MYADAIETSFSCPEDKTNEALSYINNFMKNNQIVSEKYLNFLKQKIATDYELDWGNIKGNAHYYIEEAFLGKVDFAPRERIEKFKKMTAEDINDFHKKIFKLLKKNSMNVFLKYGKKLTKKST
jgi:predicted Zn-dependent peptidase